MHILFTGGVGSIGSLITQFSVSSCMARHLLAKPRTFEGGSILVGGQSCQDLLHDWFIPNF